MATKDNPTTDRERKSVTHLVQSAAECGEVDSYGGKRLAARISDGIQLEMTEDLTRKAVAVSMHNVSETGCAFWIKRKLETFTSLYLREFTEDNSGPWMSARVTHCTQGIRGFLIGVTFVDAG